MAGESTAITSGNFTFLPTAIPGMVVVEARSFGDERGAFMETYHQEHFANGGITCAFVQDNQSSSVRGVLRGLHFPVAHPQAKLVRVVEGEVFDVGVDLRRDSPTFGQWFGTTLSAENHRQLFIPRGFAHGFYVRSERATFAYKCDDVYHPNDEAGLAWNDPTLNITWPLIEGANPILSEKDQHHPTFQAWRA